MIAIIIRDVVMVAAGLAVYSGWNAFYGPLDDFSVLVGVSAAVVMNAVHDLLGGR